jgi:hypothetical protein
MEIVKIVLVSLLCVVFLVAGGRTLQQAADGVRLDKTRPSVYLAFDHKAPQSRQLHTETSTDVWLRLHNNTMSPIALCANVKAESSFQGKLKDGTEVPFIQSGVEVDACYDVEGTPTLVSKKVGNTLEGNIPFRKKPPDQDPYKSCKWDIAYPKNHPRLWLASGDSVVFSVPNSFLAHGLNISTEFNYEWETERGYIIPGEPRHFLFFYSLDLEQALERKTAQK